MIEQGKCTLLLRGVPREVVRAVEARAVRNFRSRHNEIIAILAAACEGEIATVCAAVTEQAGGAGQAREAGQDIGAGQARAEAVMS